MTLAQFVHSVAAADALFAAPGVEREADDHRVIDGGYRNAVACQHVEIVFDVLSDFEHRIVFQQRLECFQRGAERYLFGPFGKHVAAAMIEGDVAGFVWPGCEADTDQIGAHRVERTGFGVDGDHPCSAAAPDPLVQRFDRLHAFVGRAIDGGHVGQPLSVAFAGTLIALVLRFGRIEVGRAFGAARPCIKPPQQAGETMLCKKRRQRFRWYAVELEPVERDGEVAILLQRDQHAAQLRVVAMLEQAFLKLGFFHSFRCVERCGEIAVFLDQLGRGFRSDAVNAGNVVDRIAHQREHVADKVGVYAEFFLHLFKIDALILHRIEHVDAGRAVGAIDLADQLHQVLVGGNDGDIPSFALGGAGVGRDQVVCLEALFLDAFEAEGAGGVANQRELRDQVLWRGRAIGFVFGVNVVAKGAARLVENHRQMRGPFRLVEVIGQFPQHGRVTVNRAHRRAFRIGQRGQAMIRPKNVGGTVDEVEVLLVCHAWLVSSGARRGQRPCR